MNTYKDIAKHINEHIDEPIDEPEKDFVYLGFMAYQPLYVI